MEETDKLPVRKGPGRPKKSELAKKSPGGRGKVGRPKGDAAIMKDYKARMLASPKSRKVLAKVFEVALDDDHKHQAACMKMVMDRIAPVGAFEADLKKHGGGTGITINVTGMTPEVKVEGADLDGEWERLNSREEEVHAEDSDT